MDLYISAFVGWVVFSLLSLISFSRSTPNLYFNETWGLFWNKSWVFLALGFVISMFSAYLFGMSGGVEYIARLTGDVIDGDTPFEVNVFMFGVGVLWTALLDKFRGIINKIPYTTKEE